MTPSEKRALFGRQAPVSSNPAGSDTVDSNKDRQMASLTKATGKTRGKNPRDIEYLKFDKEKPETLPKDLPEFLESTKSVNNNVPFTMAEVTDYVIDGFNLAQYSAASDEIGEFIPDSWDKETSNQFRLAVRNTSKLAGLSIEDTVAMLKPAVEKGLAAKAAAAQAKTAAEAAPASV